MRRPLVGRDEVLARILALVADDGGGGGAVLAGAAGTLLARPDGTPARRLGAMGTRNIPIAEAGPHVADVMLRDPRTVAPGTTVAEARAQFENPRVRLLLVADEERYIGAITRESLPADAAGDAPLGPLADGDALRVEPGDPVSRAMDEIAARGLDRIPVVEGDALVGLICFNGRHGHFCVDG